MDNFNRENMQSTEYRTLDPDPTIHCNALQLGATPGLSWQTRCCSKKVLLQNSNTCVMDNVFNRENIQNTEHTEYKIQKCRSSKSLQLCHRRSSTQHISAAFVIMQSSVVVGKDHFSFVEAKWWLVVTRNQSYRVEPRGWGIYSFGIAVPILYVCI